MNHERFVELVERIRHHCWRVARAAIGHRPSPGDFSDLFDSYYIHELKSCIALKRNTEQEPQFAFPPATEGQLWETEALLGFTLPPLLRLLYTSIGIGGFGPGYGIIGALNGFPLEDGNGKDIAHGYLSDIQGCTIIHLEDFEMLSWAQRDRQLKQLPSEQVLDWDNQPLQFNDPCDEERSNWEQISLYEFPHGVWPERLLPLCYWGCGIGSCIDARTERIFQVYASDRGWHYILEYRAAS